MKTYQCDGCGKVIKNPYKAKVREFFIGCNFDFGMALPENSKRKTKVHLCEDCYHGLNTIGKSNVHVLKVENGILQLEKELEKEKIKIIKNEAVRDFSEKFNFVWFRNNVYDANKAMSSSNSPEINSLDVTVPSLYLEWIASFLTERFKAEVKGKEL